MRTWQVVPAKRLSWVMVSGCSSLPSGSAPGAGGGGGGTGVYTVVEAVAAAAADAAAGLVGSSTVGLEASWNQQDAQCSSTLADGQGGGMPRKGLDEEHQACGGLQGRLLADGGASDRSSLEDRTGSH